MRYQCNEDLNKMRDVENGKYCELCRKNITDFTNHLKSDINKQVKKDTELCGIFLREQVDDNIKADVLELTKKVWLKYAAGLSFLIGSQTVEAQSTNYQTKKIVINKDTNTVCVKVKNDTINNIQNGSKDLTENKQCQSKKHNKNYNKKSLYFTKKFPFLVYKRRYFSGRF